jgi:hypothetical protein
VLQFTAVEEYFYKKRHNECRNRIHHILAKYKQHGADLTSLHSDAMKKLLRAIVRLRQACCHPQGNILLSLSLSLTQIQKRRPFFSQQQQH